LTRRREFNSPQAVSCRSPFEIEAGSLSQAIQKFPSGAEAAVERAIKELDALRREAAPSIIVSNSGLIQRP
jgi:hypothetical protein